MDVKMYIINIIMFQENIYLFRNYILLLYIFLLKFNMVFQFPYLLFHQQHAIPYLYQNQIFYKYIYLYINFYIFIKVIYKMDYIILKYFMPLYLYLL